MALLRDVYDHAVARMRALGRGTVTERDYFAAGRAPYRYAQIQIEAVEDSEVPDLMRALLEIARPAEAHIMVWTHYGPRCQIDVSLDRPLAEDEIGDNPPCASRPVTRAA